MADWSGMTVVCMASGPSLAPADVEIVRQWREAADNRRVVVTNNTYQLAPWADVLYAMDRKWWEVMKPQFAGERLTAVHDVLGVPCSSSPKGGNSGSGAILLAAHRGAARVIMLGYDCQVGAGGARHWHGDHKKPLGNAVSLPKFYGQFRADARRITGVEVVNCSRATALDMYPLGILEDELGQPPSAPVEHCYWRSNIELDHLTPRGKRFPEIGLFESLREACSGSVFEVGCGDGRLSPAFDPSAYVGMDVNPAALAKARRDNPLHQYVEEWQQADTVLAYTVLLHVPDAKLPAMIDQLKKYPRIVIGEIMGRRWRKPGIPPVFNRERAEYEALIGPVSQVIRVPYPHYNTDLELCVWR
ncbi:hypothetical protein BAY1663_02346 [Pseudomonas sp. BAY1663]|uniref:class I SAM-dependent methyltransferase n=1 Tax=Pseudomonas sp. BAY1663 TaxID=1439940 RepID=UPI00042DFD0C|nr:class I SAM-dependent methyltransferase [Pseudomonas sp. BAY1663]EXF45267.1 hypothetical protein BAY1663_02346 [Pseudomonas sp. BAY1663]